MTQYIDKSALVAEIERRREYYENIQMIKPVYESNIEDLNELLSFIDTLEVKEVDLEKCISDWLFEGLPNEDELIDYIKETAKHFFELGMAVNNKSQKGK